MSLDKSALNIELNMSKPKMRKLDYPATIELQELKKTESNVAKVWKELYTRDHRVKDLERYENELRKLVNFISHPWLERGARILAVTLYEKYEMAMARLVENVRDAHANAKQNFSNWREDGRRSLGDMFREDDYPSEADFCRAFGVTLDTGPVSIRVPSNHLYRLIEEDSAIDREEFREILLANEKENLRCVTESCAKRVFEVTEQIIKGINHKQKPKTAGRKRANTYHDSLVGNVWDLVQILPELNIAESEEIAELHGMLRADILSKLDLNNVQSHDIEKRKKVEMARMRQNLNLENDMKQAAKDIMEKASALMPKEDETTVNLTNSPRTWVSASDMLNA